MTYGTRAYGHIVSTLEGGVLHVVMDKGRRVQGMRRAVTGGAKERTAVGHAVKECASENTQGRVLSDCLSMTLGALRQGGHRPGLGHLVLGDPLIKVTVTIGAPDLGNPIL